MQKNSAPETSPCDTICTIAPSSPIAAPLRSPVLRTISYPANAPSVTNPMCAIDEYAISFFMSCCASATKPMYTTAISDSVMTSQSSSRLASGAIGRLKRRKP